MSKIDEIPGRGDGGRAASGLGGNTITGQFTTPVNPLSSLPKKQRGSNKRKKKIFQTYIESKQSEIENQSPNSGRLKK